MAKADLHALIISLSQSERRYIKLTASMFGDKPKYLAVFEAISAQKEYDEKALKAQFAGERFLKQFHVVKNYLRQLILRGLRNYHAQADGNAKVKDGLRNIALLYKRGLIAQAQDELKRTLDIAISLDRLPDIVDLHYWERKLYQSIRPGDHHGVRAIVDKIESVTQRITNRTEALKTVIKVSEQVSEQASGDKKPEAIQVDDNTATCLESKILLNAALYFNKVSRSEFEDAEETITQMITELEKMPERTQKEPELYSSMLNNAISFMLMTKQFEKASSLLERARTFYGMFKFSKLDQALRRHVLRTTNIELEMIRDTKSYEENPDHLGELEAYIEGNLKQMPMEYFQSFCFQLASIRFRMKQFDVARKWTSLVLDRNDQFADWRELGWHIRALNLMIQFELKNLFLIRYYVESARRYLKRHEISEPYKKTILRFFGRIGKLHPMGYTTEFKDFYAKLFPEKGPSLIPEDAQGMVDYQSWLYPKISKYLNNNDFR